MQLLVSNPTRRKSRKRRNKSRSRGRRRRAQRALRNPTPTFTPRRKKRRARRGVAKFIRRSTPMARRRRSSKKSRRRGRRRSSFSGFGGPRRGFLSLPPGGFMRPVATAGGMVGINLAVDKLAQNFPSISTGWSRIAAKAGVSIAAFALLKKFAPGNLAESFATGGLVAAALDVYNKLNPQGVGFIGEPGGVLYSHNDELNGMYLDDDDDPMLPAGMGDVYVDEDEDALLMAA